MAEEEDPFGAFGGSDSDSDQQSYDSSSSNNNNSQTRQVLLQTANETKSIPNSQRTETLESPAATTGGQGSSTVVDLTRLEACKLPSWDPPLYLSPHVTLVSSLPFGGGRGYVALTSLKPGTLVLVEEAIMAWPEEQLGQALTLSSIQRMLHDPNAARIVNCLEDFHPAKAVVDSRVESDSPAQVEDMMSTLHGKHKSDPLLAQLVEEAQSLSIKNRDGTLLSPDDIVRLFLALRYNGLESGIYCHVAMLNHHCKPNCVKFLPNNNTELETDLPSTYSEVRTTRWVKAGESLTISYMPKIVSHASRRRHLWQQHRFDIGVINMDAGLRRMECINAGLPSSSKEYVDEDSISSRIERSLAEMDVLYATTKDALVHQPQTTADASSWEQAKALEVTSLELFAEARRQIQNDNHLLLIPCLVLHLDACDLVLQHDTKLTALLSPAQRCKLLVRSVSTALKLVALQTLYWGDDHFDVARTCLDLSQAIEELLAKSQVQLLALDTNRADLETFRDWSSLEYKYRKEHERIKQCYPRDALEYIQTDGGGS